MKLGRFISGLLLSTLIAGAAYAADLNLIHVKDLKALLADKTKKVAVLDANGAKTRKENGTIPGAIELTSSSGYAEAELPKDKSEELVFYCYNTRCTASHDAAKRAMGFGYKNVSVLSDGIVGWNSQS